MGLTRGSLMALVVAGCSQPHRDAAVSQPPHVDSGSASAPASSRASAPAGLPPLTDPEGRVHVLALEGAEEAHVAVPLGATTPRPVVINEAVELAKRFSTEDSGRFVNGVLSSVSRALSERAAS